MKNLGIVILVIGILLTVFTTFNIVTKEKIADVGPLQITQDKNHHLGWSPIIGIGVIIAGAAVYLAGNRKRN